MLIGDAANAEIDRYDPVTGTYLGSFGRGYLSGPVYSMALDQANGIVYASDYNVGRIVKFNYSTGLYLGSTSLPATAGYFISRLSNGQLLRSDYGFVNTQRINPDGALVQTINTNGIYVEGHAQTGDGRIWFLNGSSGAPMQLYSTTLGSSSISLSYTSTTRPIPNSLSAYGNQLAAIDYSGETGRQLYSFTTSGAGVQSASSIVIGGSGFTGTGTAIGHGNVVYGLVTNGGQAIVHRWIPGNNYTSAFNLTNTTNGFGMALVVAPEPGTMIALGAGLAVLARKRMKKS